MRRPEVIIVVILSITVGFLLDYKIESFWIGFLFKFFVQMFFNIGLLHFISNLLEIRKVKKEIKRVEKDIEDMINKMRGDKND